jgi:hypothetical protein
VRYVRQLFGPGERPVRDTHRPLRHVGDPGRGRSCGRPGTARARARADLAGDPDQEIGTPDGSGYLEATAAFTGEYNGKKVRGENYVEMTGEWNS